MSMMHCFTCDLDIDTDFDAEHFMYEHPEGTTLNNDLLARKIRDLLQKHEIDNDVLLWEIAILVLEAEKQQIEDSYHGFKEALNDR